MKNTHFNAPIYSKSTFIVLLCLFSSHFVFAQSCAVPNIGSTSTGEPFNILVGKGKNDVYFTPTVPTFRDMLGVNIAIYQLENNKLASYKGLNVQGVEKTALDVFSHFRVFYPSHRDYWNFGDGPLMPYPNAEQVPKGNMSNLRLVTNASGVPLLASGQSGNFIYPIESPTMPGKIEIKTVPISAPGAYFNVYQNYMNNSWIKMQASYDYLRTSAQPINKKFTVTLELIPTNFAQSTPYEFPSTWFLTNDWGSNDAERKLNAKAYATMFARTYSPKVSDCATCPRMVDIVEIGNEPWNYASPSTYHAVVMGMIEGIDEYYGTDTLHKIRLLPASFQANHEESANPATVTDLFSWKDYLNVRLPASSKCVLEGINLHLYSNTIANNLTYNNVYPEKVAQAGGQSTAVSKFYQVINAWKWLKDNAFAKKNIFITEFGWDSEGCSPDQSVGVKTQAIYTIRNLLMMGRYGVKRANLYQIEDDPSVGCGYAYFASGVWSTAKNPKYIFKALENFVQKAGGTKFHYALREDPNDVFAYILETQEQPKYMVAWLARNINYTNDNLSLPQVIQLGGADLSDGIGALKTINISFNGKTYNPDASQPWYSLDGESIKPLTQSTYLVNGQYKLSPVPILIPITESCSPDAQAPIFANCPANITQATGGTTAVVNWTPPTATDNCTNPATITSSHNPGATFPVGVTTVTYTARDASNNAATCTFTVTISNPCTNDTQAPVFSNCPTNINQTTTGTTAIVTWTVPTATDICATPTVTSTHNSGATFPIGTTTVTYTATDARSNTATCSFTVTVTNPCANDTQTPVFANCPANITQTTTGTTVIVTWTAPTATDNCTPPPSVISSHTPGASFPIGVTTVTYTATDGKNNKATCVFTITVTNPCATDTQAPIFTNCPGNISQITAGTSVNITWTPPTASDNCTTAPIVTSTHAPNASFPIGVTTVTYTARDASNNAATCSFTVTISPQPTAYCASKSAEPWQEWVLGVQFGTINNIAQANEGKFRTGVGYSDFTDMQTTVLRAQTYPLSIKPGISWAGRLPDLYARAWIDFNGNKTFEDAEKVFEGRAQNPFNTNVFIPATVVAGVTRMRVSVKSGSFPLPCESFLQGEVEDYTINIETDGTDCVNDKQSPSFSNCPVDLTQTATGTTAIVTWTPPTAVDNCSAVTVISTHTPNTAFPIGETIVTYTATDARNNARTCTFKVTVLGTNPCATDIVKPVFTNCPTNIALTTTGTTATATWTAPTATDNCTPPPTVTSTHNSGAAFPIGTTTVTYTATDAKNNTATCVFTVTVTVTNPCETDIVKPVFANCPTNITLTTTGTTATATWTAPTATDNCTPPPTVTSTHISGTAFPIGTTTVTYTATDAKNNTATCVFTITITLSNPCATDIIKPVFTNCPTNISLTTDGTSAIATWTPPTATDNCTPPPTVTSTHNSGASFPIGTTTVTYTATDAKNNTATCVFTITVSPQTANYCVSKSTEPWQEWVTGVRIGTINNTPQANDGKYRTISSLGYSDFTDLQTTVNRGQTYPLSILPGMSWAGRLPNLFCRVWIDFNKNKVFEDVEKVFEGTAQNPFNTNVLIPTAALSGTTRMRVSIKSGSMPLACESFQFGEVEDYTLNIAGGSDCTIDVVPPVFVNCPTNISQTTTGTTALVTWTPPTATDNCPTTPTIVSSHNPNSAFPIGLTTVTYTATDAKNNVATCTFTVTVTNLCAADTQAPVFTSCPSNISQTTTTTSAIVTWTLPTATDNCTTPTITSTHNPNTAFPMGTTTVIYTARDANSNSITCTFTVNVTNPCANDIIAPVFANCPTNITQTAIGTTATVTWTPPTATDNCTATPTVTSTHTPNTAFSIGVTTVIYTARDARNNATTCTFNVTVSSPSTSYCPSKSTEPWQEWVSGVVVGGINNTLQANQGKFRDINTLGYSNFTDLPTTLLKGQTYPLSIRPGFSWTGRLPDLYCRVWVDFNGNNVFEDSEKVFEGRAQNPFNTNLLIPATSPVVNARMRVSIKSGGYPLPCENFQLGEVEDYLLIIQ